MYTQFLAILLKIKNIISKSRGSKVTDFEALTEMPTILIFAESYRFSWPNSALRFLMSKLRQIKILKCYQI